MTTVTERFFRYVTVNTTSSEESTTFPSTASQLAFGQTLAEECRQIGLADAVRDDFGYVYATLPATAPGYPTIGLIAHMDTSPQASGQNVRPQIHRAYDGGDIVLEGVTISPAEFPFLQNYIGCDIITASGDTLLGADDKAGVAEIMTAMEYLLAHPEIPHGPVRIAFTPDEEVGSGADHFDVARFGAAYAYTMDGDALGELQYENFNADKAVIRITGKSVHPGSAKGIMVNAARVAARFAEAVPLAESPAGTEGYEGFYHLTHMRGEVESAQLEYILRGFEAEGNARRIAFLQQLAADISAETGALIEVEVTEQYRNMREVVEACPAALDLAKAALSACGLDPQTIPIRGGTDGSRLSFMGLPCPNLGTGGHNFHGPYELITVQAMEQAVLVIAKLCELAVDFPVQM